MEPVKILLKEDIELLVRHRAQESKIADCMQFAKGDWRATIEQSEAEYVLLGIAEDIGVRANFGRPGAATAFRPALESFVNQQSNRFMDGKDVLLLGEIHSDDLMSEARLLDPRKQSELALLREMVTKLDERVTQAIACIVRAGKIPLVVGGGHNNSFGNICGTSDALSEAVNVINCDPHLDFRPLEGRHSGNGFSYAFQKGAINRYAVFCMHEQYNSEATLAAFNSHNGQLFYHSFEKIFVRGEVDYARALQQCLSFVSAKPCGVELDVDAISNIPSSAKTSSGISALQARQYAFQCGLQLDSRYLHIAEAAPVLSHIKADNKTGKLIAYLITDFIKGRKMRQESLERKTVGYSTGAKA